MSNKYFIDLNTFVIDVEITNWNQYNELRMNL